MTKTKFTLVAFSLLIFAAAFGAVPSFDSFDPVYFASNNFKITLKTTNFLGGSIATVSSKPAAWVWMASSGVNANDGGSAVKVAEQASLWLSADGTNWVSAGLPPVFDPLEYTNSAMGPISREWALFYTNGTWFASDNFDPYNAGGNAQGIRIWKSQNLTNWIAETVIYPFGITNSGGNMFAPTWFRDTDGGVYMLMSYTNAGGFQIRHFPYLMKATDNTMTNWGVPVIATIPGGSRFAYDGQLSKTTNNIYHLHYKGDGGWIEATNGSLSADPIVFTASRTNIFPSNIDPNNNEGIAVIKVSGTHWRAYIRQGLGNGREYYVDSFDDQVTWAANWTLVGISNGFWHGPGISPIATSEYSTNKVQTLGTEGQTELHIEPELMTARALKAEQGDFTEGLVVGNLVSRSGIYARTFEMTGNAANDGRFVVVATNIAILEDGGVLAFYFDGNGSALTSLNANNLASGTVPAVRFPFTFNTSGATNVITSQNANYNVLSTDSVILLNGNLTATLPTAVGIPGKNFTIVCKTAGTNGILSTSSQTFLGYGNTAAAKWTNSVVGRSTTVMSDGANWIVTKSDN